MKKLFIKQILQLNTQLIAQNSIKCSLEHRLILRTGHRISLFNNVDKVRFFTSQVKPLPRQFSKQNDSERLSPSEKPIVSVLTLDLNNKQSEHVIDIRRDNTRREIGFETESVLDDEWKEVKVDSKKLLFNYSKLSKKNLTGRIRKLKKIYI